MPMTDLPEIEALQVMRGKGDREALRYLIPLLCDKLRKVARQQLRKIPAARTLEYRHLHGEAQS